MLQVEELQAGYGGVTVLRKVDFTVGDRECVAVLGRNGMGKTTLLRTIMGIVPASGGQVSYKGEPLRGRQTHEIARMGIAYVPQGRGIFPKLTVEENLRMGTRAAPSGDKIPEYIYGLFPILAERRRQKAGTLSGGQQQMLAIGRALCGRPSVMLLDEPSEGIQPSIVQELGSLIPAVAAEHGLSIVIVEQNLGLASSMADRAIVLDKGQVVYEGDGRTAAANPEIERWLTV